MQQILLCRLSALSEGLLPLAGLVVTFIVLLSLGLRSSGFSFHGVQKIAASRPWDVKACLRRGCAFIGASPRLQCAEKWRVGEGSYGKG